MSRKKTHEEFVAEMAIKHPDIEVLSEYHGNKVNVHLRCKICGCEWWARPNALLKSNHPTGCPACAKIKMSKIKTKSHEKFMKDFFEKNSHNIHVKGRYAGAKNPIDVECLDCGFEWLPQAGDILADHGCPVCAGVYNYTADEYKDIYRKLSPNTTLLSEYANNKTPIHRLCNTCGYDWWCLPGVVRQGCGCPNCTGSRMKTTQEFVIMLHEVNPFVEVAGEYRGRHTNIKVRCIVCGHEWEAQPGNLLAGWGCPKCSSTRGERRIMAYLDAHNLPYKYQHKFDDCKNTFLLPFDIYLPLLNTVIEYDGEQHFSPVLFGGKNDIKAEQRFRRTQENDAIKNQYCDNNNIVLIRIPYTDYDNIETILDKHLA